MPIPKESDPGKSMDIAKSGKTSPDTSARPVIITHEPVVQDPMVKPDESTPGPSITSETSSIKRNNVIQPISQTEKDSTAKLDKEQETVSNTDKDDAETEKDTRSTKEIEESKESAVVDAVADQANVSRKKDGELSEAEKQQQETIDKLIADKKYFVHVGQQAHRRNKRALIGVVVFILILAGLYLAVDAGLIRVSVNLPIDLIPN